MAQIHIEKFRTDAGRADQLDRALQAAALAADAAAPPGVWDVRLFAYACMREWVKAALHAAAYRELIGHGYEPDEAGLSAMLGAVEKVGYALAVDEAGMPRVVCKGGSHLDVLMGVAWCHALESGRLSRQPMPITFTNPRPETDG